MPNRLNLLNAIDFEVYLNEKWIDVYYRLVKYKKEYKTTRVPRGDSQNAKLAVWVARKRAIIKAGKMLPNRLELLNAIDFTWDCRLRVNA